MLSAPAQCQVLPSASLRKGVSGVSNLIPSQDCGKERVHSSYWAFPLQLPMGSSEHGRDEGGVRLGPHPDSSCAALWGSAERSSFI